MNVRTVVWGFLGDCDVMRVVLPDRRWRYTDKLRVRTQFLDITRPHVTHPSSQTSHQLVGVIAEWSLERYSTLDPFRHQLVARFIRFVANVVQYVPIGFGYYRFELSR